MTTLYAPDLPSASGRRWPCAVAAALGAWAVLATGCGEQRARAERAPTSASPDLPAAATATSVATLGSGGAATTVARPPLSLQAFTIPEALLDAEAVRCEPVTVSALRQGEAVEMEVIARAEASHLVVAPAAGTLTRTARGWPRLGEWTGQGGAPGPGGSPALLGLLVSGPTARAASGDGASQPERWRPATVEVGGRPSADPQHLQLALPAGWIERVLVGPGARVAVGTPLLRWVADDGLAARLRLSAADVRRLGTLVDADVVVLEGKRAPWVESALWQDDPGGDGGWLVARLPPGNAAPADASPGDRVAALLRTGAAQPRLAVPRQAVVRRGVERFVWVRADARRFGRHEVALGVDGGDRVEVLFGVEAGACVVVAGQDVIEAAVGQLRGADTTPPP